MKKFHTIIFLIVTSALGNLTFAQDQIETTGGHTYEVKIVEETAEYVEFYFLHDEEKEIRKMSVKNIGKIVRNAWDDESNKAKVEEVATADAKKDASSEKTSGEAKVTKPDAVSKEVKKEVAVATSKEPAPNPKETVAKTAEPVKKPIEVKEENDIKCLYSKDDANTKITKTLTYNSVNINSSPIALLKKFTLENVVGVREGDKIYLVFKVSGQSNFSMKAKNKLLIKLSNGSVVDLYNERYTPAEYKSSYEASFKIEVPEFHLADLIEHKSLRFRLILDKGYIEFTNNARTSHWVSRALLCVS